MAASIEELTSLVIEPEHIVESGGIVVSDDASGSYGFVYEVKVKGVVRIAKKPHTFFLKKAYEAERASVLASFKKECVLLNKLRHPNVVKFVGVYFGEGGKDDISMVMEKVDFELASFLRESSDVQLVTKLSILQDVSYGLVYLHEYNPPIIHRDLTARNILLTKAYQAKIADVGVAKLLDQTAMKAAAHTKAPGQMFYMPPEACMEKAECTSKLDIFSFGHLSLHVLLEDYPEVFEVKVTSEMLSDGTVQIMRRKSSLDLIGISHCLYPFITQCLMDEPEKRPNTRDVNNLITDIKEANSRDINKIQSDNKMEYHSSNGMSMLEKCVHGSEEYSVQVTDLLAEKNELKKKLEERDKAILALQQESNGIICKNQDLEAKCTQLSSKSVNQDLQVKDLQEHIKAQNRILAELKEDHSMEQSVEIYHGGLEFDCENSSCKKLHMESSFLEEKLATARLSICSSQKIMAQLQKERDKALDESAIAHHQAETFKSDFEVERKDRERAQGLLDEYRNKSSTTELYEKAIADLEKELHIVNQNMMNLKKKLSIAEVELKKCRSGSTVLDHLKSTTEKKFTHENEHYDHESEPSTLLPSEMNQVKVELKRTKDIVKQQKREIDCKKKNIASLNAAVKRKEGELVNARNQIARGSKARIQLIETDTKLKTANKELRKAKSMLDNISKQSHKAKFQRGSKTEVQSSKTENVSIDDQAQYFKSIEMENEYLKSDLEDQKSQNDELKKLLMEMTEYSGVPEEVRSGTGDSPQQQSFLGGVFSGLSLADHQELEEMCDQAISPIKISSMAQKDEMEMDYTEQGSVASGPQYLEDHARPGYSELGTSEKADMEHKDEKIGRFARQADEEVNPHSSHQDTHVQLVCPICGHTNFGGQMQKFKEHVDNCF